MGTIVLVGIINPWAFIPAGIVTIILLFIRDRFAPISRSLKRLTSVTRSPIYSQLTSTVQGLQVIRSYRAEKTSCREFFRCVNDSSRVLNVIVAANRWSAMRFDMVALIFVASITILAVMARILQQQFSVVDVTLTLTYSLNLMGLLQWTIR